MNPMANSAARELETLSRQAYRHSRGIQRKQQLLASFIQHTPLPLEMGGHYLCKGQ